MATDHPDGGPEFDVTHDEAPGETLLVGVTTPALAGLTAVDYLVDHLDFEQAGHVSVDQFPAITPFEEGTPRHHTRLFDHPDRDLTVLVGELFVPTAAAGPFSDAVFDWVEGAGVDEITVLSGVPVPHGPEEHRTFYVATEDYQADRLAGSELPPMGSGFQEGVNAELTTRGISSPLAVGTLVTPVHAQTPDVEATLRLIDAVSTLYDLDVDTEPLEAFAAEVEQYYRDLSERMTESERREPTPADRMYM